MNSASIPAAMLTPGVVVMTSGGPRVVTSVGEYDSYGMQMWGWHWTPEPRRDGLQDCGYSGIALEQAEQFMVALA